MRPTHVVLLILGVLVSGPASAELRVGVAKADVTPQPGGRMYGYGARGTNVSTGVHDPLYAKALVATDGRTTLAIVTLDLGYVDKAITARVRGLVRDAIGFDTVLIFASHTHSGPTFDRTFPSPNAPYVREMERTVAKAIEEAHANLQAARLGVGWGRVEEGHNRRKVLPDGTVEMRWENRARIPTSPVDQSVAVIAINTPSGQPIATLVNFTCHPVVLGPENLSFSADYPGAMMAMVEARNGGQAMFLQGAAGDINPFWDKTPLAEGAFDQMKKMGETLAREVLRVRGGIEDLQDVDTLSIHREVVPLEARWDLDVADVRAAVRRDYQERFARERDAEINTLLLGPDLAIATFPGEFFVEHGLRLKQGSLIRNTIFAGYSNGHLGYFPTIRAAAEGGYGGDRSTIVEVGAGEKLVSRALINLHYQAGKLSRVP